MHILNLSFTLLMIDFASSLLREALALSLSQYFPNGRLNFLLIGQIHLI